MKWNELCACCEGNRKDAKKLIRVLKVMEDCIKVLKDEILGKTADDGEVSQQENYN